MHIKGIYENINQRSGNRFSILETAIRTFTEKQAAQASAGLAYYTFFSIFPLMLVFIAGGSYFLDSHQVFNAVTQFILQALPISKQVINENLEEILQARWTAGVISLLILLWSASGMFTNLAYNINLAWPRAARRNFLQSRLVGLWMILGLIGLMAFSIILGWVTARLPFINVDNGSPTNLLLLRILSALGSWLMIFLVFLTLYRWIPRLRTLALHVLGSPYRFPGMEGRYYRVWLVRRERFRTVPTCLWLAGSHCGVFVPDLHHFVDHTIWCPSGRSD